MLKTDEEMSVYILQENQETKPSEGGISISTAFSQWSPYFLTIETEPCLVEVTNVWESIGYETISVASIRS